MAPRKSSKAAQTPQDRPTEASEPEARQPIPSPAADPTNPYNQGGWSANERASDRRNSEPGMTERERKRRKY